MFECFDGGFIVDYGCNDVVVVGDVLLLYYYLVIVVDCGFDY